MKNIVNLIIFGLATTLKHFKYNVLLRSLIGQSRYYPSVSSIFPSCTGALGMIPYNNKNKIGGKAPAK